MNKSVKDIRTQQEQKELFVEMFLEEFDKWAAKNPPKKQFNFTEAEMQKIRKMYSK